MRFIVSSLLGIALLAPAAACSDTSSKQCNTVCQKETDCAEEQSNNGEPYPYDLDECVAACVNLEADKSSIERVKEHMRCAEKAGTDCEALMNCQI